MAAGAPGARFRHAVNAGDEAAAAMLLARGLRLVRHFWHMGVQLPDEVDAGTTPAGIAITSLGSPGDLREVHAVLDEAFADHWDYHREPFERWADDLTGGPDYDPLLWRLARDGGDGRVVGALTAGVLDESGWVTLLGVRADSRGRGIALALLRHAFAGFAERGTRSILLVVDAANPTGATRLYERAGMKVVKRFDVWERRLAGSALS
jgi:ribosomal protein S18 acetylase RimI-like enzyme